MASYSKTVVYLTATKKLHDLKNNWSLFNVI